MNTTQRDFIVSAAASAVRANHPFPWMAAAEAALESNYGLSGLAREAKNLFGMKQHTHPVYGTLALPTREFENGAWIQTTADWVKYPDQASCFADRLATLNRLASVYPHYAAALKSTDPLEYVIEVSQTWSTDPHRAAKVIAIYQDYLSTENEEHES